ncbi:hypothetical protein OIO90_002256 [Microbotryomycetes sp. JL221]|nr:hypothetical protein OIO90_002256 [Microbotryomycetes sp. JL221]
MTAASCSGILPLSTLRRLALLGAGFSATAPTPSFAVDTPTPALPSMRLTPRPQVTILASSNGGNARNARHISTDVGTSDASPRSRGAKRRRLNPATVLTVADQPSSGIILGSNSRLKVVRTTSRRPTESARPLSLSSLFRPAQRTLQTAGPSLAHETSSSSSHGQGTVIDDDARWPPGGQHHDERRRPSSNTRSQPFMDEINTLMRHPALHDPVLKPRLPIVLCHGLYGFDVRGPTFFRLHYWGDLLKILRGKIGAEVFVTSVPGTGSIKHRANALHHSLSENQELRNQDLNLVAHSMGGLDSRYLLTKIRPETYRPQSLTTLSTPHRGSEFMAWCRANIGIGTDYEATTEAAAQALHRDETIPLPYSLKTPILTRAQREEAQKLAEVSEKARAEARKLKASINIPGLPYSFSASVATYLLDLLDSPAYANLTPTFLNEAFNPATPNRDDIRYYSVAARTDRIPVWHPLWLPKQVLDGTEAAREAKGKGAPARWRGNDGLVTIESAKWGEFLGVVDNCDHWNMRGSSGLVSAAASAQAIQEVTGLGKREGTDAPGKANGNGWQWQDLYALIGSKRKVVKEGVQQGKGDVPADVASSGSDKGAIAKFQAPASPTTPAPSTSEDSKSLTTVATWVINHLPGVSAPAQPSAPVSQAEKQLEAVRNTSGTSLPSIASDKSSSASALSQPTINGHIGNSSNSNIPRNVIDTARLLYGAGPSRPSNSNTPSFLGTSSPKPEKFSLERMMLGLCLDRCVSSSGPAPTGINSNRDEFLARPTTRAQFHSFDTTELDGELWRQQPTIDKRVLSGLDLMAGGTWLGLSLRRTDKLDDVDKGGAGDGTQARLRFATLTNVTETIDQSVKRPSRGDLVKRFLAPTNESEQQMDSFLQEIEERKDLFAGFNLVVGELSDTSDCALGYVSNREDNGKRARRIQVPKPGAAQGVSNATLEATADEPIWPKVVNGCKDVQQAVWSAPSVNASEDELVKQLWRALSTASPAPIKDRTHLRQTVLVRPLMMDPIAPLPEETPAFEPAPSGTSAPAVDELGPYTERIEGQDGMWYATRVQSIVLIERPQSDGEGKVRVVFREREAYKLQDRKPVWSGDERCFELFV